MSTIESQRYTSLDNNSEFSIYNSGLNKDHSTYKTKELNKNQTQTTLYNRIYFLNTSRKIAEILNSVLFQESCILNLKLIGQI